MEISKFDTSAISAWLINQHPPSDRIDLVSQVGETIRTHFLCGGPYAECVAPSIFGPQEAQQLWDDLSESVRQTATSQADADYHVKKLELFFKPEVAFVPVAHAGKVNNSEWGIKLTPAEVRQRLGVSSGHAKKLGNFITKCLKSISSNELTIGVLPYADTLALPALLYSMADRIDGNLHFRLASFYDVNIGRRESNYILSDRYQIGYATAFQFSKAVKSEKLIGYAINNVFPAPFTRSIVLREWERDEGEAPPYEVLSFVGEFAGEKYTPVDWSEPGFPKKINFLKSTVSDISARLDPIVDWETELLLLQLSKVRKSREGAKNRAVGQATFISTDAHLWATYSGLISSHRNTTSPDDFFHGIKIDGESVRIGSAYWSPDPAKPSLPDSEEEADNQSQLCWFMPEALKNTDECRAIDTLIAEFITHPVKKMFSGFSEEYQARDVFLADSRRIGRCLLAPLLEAHPLYRGPLLATPPEQWLVKLISPDAHIHHVPYWRDQVKKLSTPRSDEIALSPDPVGTRVAVSR